MSFAIEALRRQLERKASRQAPEAPVYPDSMGTGPAYPDPEGNLPPNPQPINGEVESEDAAGQLAQAVDELLEQASALRAQGDETGAWEAIGRAEALMDGLLTALDVTEPDETDGRSLRAGKTHKFEMPDGSYGIDTCADVGDAALLAHHSKTYSFNEVKAHVLKAKKALGCSDDVLPKTWLSRPQAGGPDKGGMGGRPSTPTKALVRM